MALTRESDLARVGAVIGEPARAAMLDALMSGQALTAGQLAARAHVTPATASAHLTRMVESGLLTRRRSGRERYFTIATEDVAAALEALARISPARSKLSANTALRFARTCYDHLAGTLGVLLTDTMRERGLIAGTNDFSLTPPGEKWLEELGVDVAQLRTGRRVLTRACLDWSERRHHLAGAVGAAIASTMLERRWLSRIEGTRAVRLTARGREGLHRALALDVM